MTDAARGPDAAARDENPPSLPALARALAADALASLRERLHLAALESQQFVHAAGKLLAFGVAAAVLALATWFVVVAALVALMVHLGLSLPLALAFGALLNGAGAVFAWSAMRRQLSSMGFAATLQSLQFARKTSVAAPAQTAAPFGESHAAPFVAPTAGPDAVAGRGGSQ